MPEADTSKQIFNDEPYESEGPVGEEPYEEEPISWFMMNGKNLTEQQFGEWLTKQVDEHPVVKNYHGEWKELIEWEEGNQFSKWDDDTRSVTPVEFKRRRKRLVINLMKPLVETIEGKLNFFYSVIGVPNSSESKDIYGSQVATRLIEQNNYTNDMDDLMEKIKFDLLRPGNAAQKWIWDTNITGMVAPKKDGKPDPSKSAPEKGDVAGEVVPIFNLRPDPTAREPKKLRWVVEIKEVTLQELRATFPEASNYDLPDTPKDKYKGMNVNQKDVDKNEETRILREFWEKPTPDYKGGRFLVYCGNKCLHSGKNPSPKGALPFFWFFYNKGQYNFWSHGPLYYVQGIQREFNRMVSIISEHVEAWRPKMMVGKGGLRVANSLTMDSVELVEVDFARGEPRPVQNPTLSSEVTAWRDFLIGSLDRVSNIHEVSYSRLPQYASRAPASLYEMMLEQENIKLNTMIKGVNKTLVEMTRFRLQLMNDHYDMPRMVRIVGQNKKAAIAYYDKADLNGNYDVRLEMGVSMNQSTTVQGRMLIEMFEKGILDQKDKPKILKLLNLGTAEQELRSDIADTEKAMRENQSFMDGTQRSERGQGGVWLYIHDDHALHMEFHTNLMKSEEAQTWDDARLDDLDFHINQHFMILQTVMAASQQGGQLPTQTSAQQLGHRGTTPGREPQNQPQGTPPGPEQGQQTQSAQPGAGGPLPNQVIL